MTSVNLRNSNEQSRTVLTPYLIPPGSKKVLNVGDGIILKAVERRLGSFAPAFTFSSRAAPTVNQKQTMERNGVTVLAGANQLNDTFTPWPGLTADELHRSSHVLVPMGVGLHGEPDRNVEMSANTSSIMDIIHQRTRYSSWRCPRTVIYLVKTMPHLAPQVLMTGCPVLYDKPLLDSSSILKNDDTVAVTVTERDVFWERETLTIDFVARRFPASKKVLVIHQDYLARKRPWLADRLLGARRQSAYGLRRYALARGFEISVPATNIEAIDFYRSATLHIGSRLHAHLHMLSQNKWSFLTKVDERSTGIAEHFGFPLCDPSRFADYMDFDFETVRQAALRTFPMMQKFVESIDR
ncbi:polysaccharide pyruvyl transferase family protein [Roseovarius autotrophicus]|uniref:polysaccharide pyruvyl transferase family protein n=1 Tax=Roseovarius autotrophicus TaxID=2824121 RepID=UPI001B39491E|nr:polysaccharide pyruvyl transferase family protein [Roseovarius autotrophicus]